MRTAHHTRRVAAIDDAGRGILLEQPVPAPEPGQVLVRVCAASISPGTELNLAKQLRQGEPAPVPLPHPFGYQNSGVVEAVGAGVERLRPGDRVACLGGGYAYISDWAVVPQNLCCPLPEGVSFEQGAFANLVLTALQAMRRAGTALGERVLVVGAGLVGQLAAQLARMGGMEVMVWDALDARLALARRCGAHATANVAREDARAAADAFTEGQGFDTAVLAIGGEGTQAFQDVLNVMAVSPDGHQTGRIVLVGGLKLCLQGGAGIGNVDVLGSARTGPGYHDPAWEHGRTSYPPVFVRWNTQTSLAWAHRQIERGELRIDPLITHRYPLAQVREAVDLLIDQPNEALGVVLANQPDQA